MSIDKAIELAKKKLDEDSESVVRDVLDKQEICREFIEYLKSEDGTKTLELLSLMSEDMFVMFNAQTSYDTMRTFPAGYEGIHFSYHGGFGFHRISAGLSSIFGTYDGEKRKTLKRLRVEELAEVLEKFEVLIGRANKYRRGQKKIAVSDFLTLFKEGVRLVADRISRSGI